MYSLYRRHQDDCRFRKKGIRHTTCTCPVWIDGYNQFGKRKRFSLKTRSWTQAQFRLVEIETGRAPFPDPEPQSPQINTAVGQYLDDGRARKLQPSTIISYAKTLEHLAAFFPGKQVGQIKLDGLTQFRAARVISAASATKEIQTLRSFFQFCLDREWITKNPARRLKPPKTDRLPTMPFTQDEVDRILEACNRIDNPNPREIPRARLRARALVLMLLYGGFRISDAVKLERTAVDMVTGRLLVRMMKTRAPLYIQLPPIALAALKAVPIESFYFFWSGKSKLSTAVGSARRTIDCVLKLAQVPDGHPHRFRDTFSVALLANGSDLRTVQLLLGHASIRTTEKHYAPFVVSMQRILDEAVSTLSFGVPDAHPRVHPKQDALRDTKLHTLTPARPKGA